MARSAAPELEPDEWWAEDLEGLRSATATAPVGTVTRLLALPSCEVLEVRADDGRELLVPLVADAVRTRRRRAAGDRRRPLVPGGVTPWRSMSSRCSPRRSTGSARSATSPTRSRTATGSRLRQLPGPHAAAGPARWTTPRSAGAPAWFCALTSSRRRCVHATARTRPSCPRARRVVALTPRRARPRRRAGHELAAETALTLLCGRYEGFDERILEHFASEQLSIGRYVLAGGELRRDGRLRRGAAQAARRAGPRGSALEESFSAALGGAPGVPPLHPSRGVSRLAVPEVLLSGHHAKIRELAPSSRRGRAASWSGEPPARYRTGSLP